MNVNNSVLVIYIEAIIYLLLHNLHDCVFKDGLSGQMTWQFLNVLELFSS